MNICDRCRLLIPQSSNKYIYENKTYCSDCLDDVLDDNWSYEQSFADDEHHINVEKLSPLKFGEVSYENKR